MPSVVNLPKHDGAQKPDGSDDKPAGLLVIPEMNQQQRIMTVAAGAAVLLAMVFLWWFFIWKDRVPTNPNPHANDLSPLAQKKHDLYLQKQGGKTTP